MNKDEKQVFQRSISLSSSSGRNTEDREPPTTPSSTITTTGYDWESDKRRSKPLDDGTMSFFWRAHTITCLVIAMSYLFYVAILEQPSDNSSYNTKR
jgi:phosphatidylserine synthase 2